MNIIETISQKIKDHIDLEHIEIIDESEKHVGHKENKGYGISGTHLKIKIISKDFENKSMLERHRLINEILKELIGNRIHALSLDLRDKA